MTTLPPDLVAKAQAVLRACTAPDRVVATAESCTGGLIAACLTAIPGSSKYLDRGFVTYSNAAKTDMLGVPAARIASDGAVSEAVARAMAEGAIAHSRADVAVAVTGIAGPDGGTPTKPVGLVHMAAARRNGATLHQARLYAGDRDAIRHAATADALDLLAAVAG